MKKTLILLTIFILISKDVYAWDVSANCIGFWKLNENAASSAVDDTQDNYEGVLKAADVEINTSTVTAVGKLNGGFTFDFTTSERNVDLGDNVEVDKDAAFSAEAWIKTSRNDANEQTIVSKMDSGEGWTFQVVNDTICFFLGKAGTEMIGLETDDVNVQDGNWHHVVVTFDGTNDEDGFTCYMDNAVKAFNPSWDASTLTSNYPTNADLAIGCRKDDLAAITQEFDGVIDNVRLYDKELSAAEVEALYNSGNGTEALTDENRRIILVQ